MNKKILITGGTGTVGKHLQKIIPHGIFLGRSHENGGDLKDPQYVKWLMSSYSPDVVVHLAAKVGGIQENIQQPALLSVWGKTIYRNIKYLYLS